MHDEETESPELDSTPGFDGVLEAIAAAPRPRVSSHLHVQLPEPLSEAFVNEAQIAPPRTPRTGDVIDERYRIEGMLGAGGMGVVFSATHLATGRRVAFKWLQLASLYRTESEREAALKRFVREAKAAGRIRHPNVVDVYDAGTSPRAPFLVMELLEGETLRARIDRGALGWDEALRLFVPAMEGVAEVHRQGVVHRDLKPDNIFLAKTTTGEACPKVWILASRVFTSSRPTNRRRHSRAPVRPSARPRTCHSNNCGPRATWTPGRMSMLWAWCSTRCSRRSGPSWRATPLTSPR